jgi:hypothetical protein
MFEGGIEVEGAYEWPMLLSWRSSHSGNSDDMTWGLKSPRQCTQVLSLVRSTWARTSTVADEPRLYPTTPPAVRCSETVARDGHSLVISIRLCIVQSRTQKHPATSAIECMLAKSDRSELRYNSNSLSVPRVLTNPCRPLT